jgi:hypothetical protein
MKKEPAKTKPLSMTAQKKMEALEKRLRAKLLKERDADIMKYVSDKILPVYQEKLDKADAILKRNRPFTNSEYRLILAALHPDSSSDKRIEAFTLVKSKELLLREPDQNFSLSAGLPKTLAELKARRKK